MIGTARSRRRFVRREACAAWLFAVPGLIGLTLFVALPFLVAVVLSFTDLRLGSPLPTRFVALAQFGSIFEDEAFLRALLNNSLFALVVVPVQTALALALALLLARASAGMVVFRTLFFLPVVFPMSLVAVIWVLLSAPGPDGVLNTLLDVLSLGAWEPRDFLRDPALALPVIMLLSIWQGAGFQMVVVLAGLQSIPRELYEAAALDGAGGWGRFRHVTLPQLRNTLLFVVMITTILAFRLFDQVQIMTQGGPQNATTTVMFEAVRAAFSRQQVARASAMTVVLFVIVLGVTVALRRVIREERTVS